MSNFPKGFNAGVSVRGLPVLNTYGGNIYWVDSGSGVTGAGTFERPDATLAAALDRCTASNGDIIMVKPGHAETLTAQLDFDVAGTAILGLGTGNLRPTLTINGAIDGVDISAANTLLGNVIFAVPGTDAQTADVNIDAAGVTVWNTLHHGSTTAKNKVDIITLTANADDAVLDGVRIYNDTVECVGGIKLEGACSRVEVANTFVMDTIGFTNGAIYDAATATEVYVHDSIFSNAKAATVVAEFGNNTTGVMSKCFINGRHTTIQSNLTPGTGMAFHQVFGVEEAAKNGLLMPVVDAE
jgi:hypothetical protein